MEICIMKNGQSAPNDMQLHDKKNLKLEYPVDVYQLNLNKLQTGFIRWHWHEEMEIATVLSGRVLYKIADDTIELGTGQGIIVTPNVLHSIYPQGDTECILQVVIFHPVFLFDYSETYMCTKYIAPVTAGYRYMALTEDKVYTEKVLRTLSDLYFNRIRCSEILRIHTIAIRNILKYVFICGSLLFRKNSTFPTAHC